MFIGNVDEDFGRSGMPAYIACYMFVALQVACLVSWGWALNKLYAEVKKAKDLLPNKNIFRLHGALLVTYLVLYLGCIASDEITATQVVGSEAQYNWTSA